VPRESNNSRLEDLKGASFAFTDPLSNTGHLVPTYELYLLGKTPVSFFSGYIFTYSHDNSILAVANKLIQGAAVDSLVYDKLTKENLELARMTKIATRWGPYGIPPVVISPTLDFQLKQQLRDSFLTMHDSSKGRKILNELAIERFVTAPDSIYDSIREMKKQLGWN
jgi:phosphonate transport system substrate-binding protein